MTTDGVSAVERDVKIKFTMWTNLMCSHCFFYLLMLKKPEYYEYLEFHWTKMLQMTLKCTEILFTRVPAGE